MKPFILFLLVLALCSCEIVYFEKPQPRHTKELKSIPSELTGIYAEIKDDSIKDQIADSLIITSDLYHYITHDHKLLDKNRIGSLETGNMVLKKMDGYYILSQKVMDDKGKIYDDIWEINVLKYNDNQLSIYSMSGEDEKLFTDSVRRIVPLKEKKVEDGTVQMINPTKKQFKELLDNKLWKKAIQFEKIK